MSSPFTVFVACLALLVLAPQSEAQDLVDGFAARTFVGVNGRSMPYRLFVPKDGDRVQTLPAIIYLHGSGVPRI